MFKLFITVNRTFYAVNIQDRPYMSPPILQVLYYRNNKDRIATKYQAVYWKDLTFLTSMRVARNVHIA
jgi:hypothetical protein